MRSITLLSAVLTFAAACGGTERVSPEPFSEVRVRFDTIDGIVHVRNDSSGLWAEGDAWRIEEVWRIGGADGDPAELFGNMLVALSVGPDGRLYVLDWQSSEVRVFDRSGTFLHQFAGRGEGRGELDAPASLGWDGWDRLWIPNLNDGRYTVFDTTGQVLKTIRVEPRAASRRLYPIYFTDGAFVDHVAGAGVQFLRRDTTGRATDTLAFLPPGYVLSRSGRPGLSDDAREAFRRLLPRRVWTIGPDGSFWEGRVDAMRLIRRGMDGDTLRIVETRHRPTTLSPADRELVDRVLDELGEDIPFGPDILQMIYVMPDGHVLAQVAPPDGEPGEVLDVFDPEGRFLGSLNPPFTLRWRALHAFHGDTLYAVTTDELDVPYVVRATIHR